MGLRTEFAHWRIAFGEVRHTRVSPVRHAFRASSFHLRIPVHLLDGRRAGNWLFGLNRPALMGFRESDHGEGGPSREWILGVLARAGIEDCGEIWLHTFARVAGFAFKPVSFWFVHGRDASLRAVLAEVNNTFGQRHCYLLSADDGGPIRRGQLLRADKQLHVSPFNHVEGHYEFRFMDTGQRSVARIDVHPESGAILQTSLSGRFEGLNVANCLRALFTRPFFSLAVIVNIHWQALRLWLRGLPLDARSTPPEVFVTRGH